MRTELIIKKLKSLRLNLEVHPDNEENSEFADRISDLDSIIQALSEPSELQKEHDRYKELYYDVSVELDNTKEELKKAISKPKGVGAEEVEQIARKEILEAYQNPTSNVHGQYIGFQLGYKKAMHDYAGQSDAVEFAEWLAEFGSICYNPSLKNKVTIIFDADKTNNVCSISDAYQQFLNREEK
jgi:ribosomal protein L23